MGRRSLPCRVRHGGRSGEGIPRKCIERRRTGFEIGDHRRQFAFDDMSPGLTSVTQSPLVAETAWRHRMLTGDPCGLHRQSRSFALRRQQVRRRASGERHIGRFCDDDLEIFALLFQKQCLTSGSTSCAAVSTGMQIESLVMACLVRVAVACRARHRERRSRKLVTSAGKYLLRGGGCGPVSQRKPLPADVCLRGSAGNLSEALHARDAQAAQDTRFRRRARV